MKTKKLTCPDCVYFTEWTAGGCIRDSGDTLCTLVQPEHCHGYHTYINVYEKMPPTFCPLKNLSVKEKMKYFREETKTTFQYGCDICHEAKYVFLIDYYNHNVDTKTYCKKHAKELNIKCSKCKEHTESCYLWIIDGKILCKEHKIEAIHKKEGAIDLPKYNGKKGDIKAQIAHFKKQINVILKYYDNILEFDQYNSMKGFWALIHAKDELRKNLCKAFSLVIIDDDTD